VLLVTHDQDLLEEVGGLRGFGTLNMVKIEITRVHTRNGWVVGRIEAGVIAEALRSGIAHI
jgi:hypothetical protein